MCLEFGGVQNLSTRLIGPEKANDLYNLAIKLGIKNATETEKQIFKKEIFRLCAISIDLVRSDIETLLHKASDHYINILDTKIVTLEDADLSIRAYNALKQAKIETMNKLFEYRRSDVAKFKNMGQKSMDEIINWGYDNEMRFKNQ